MYKSIYKSKELKFSKSRLPTPCCSLSTVCARLAKQLTLSLLLQQLLLHQQPLGFCMHGLLAAADSLHVPAPAGVAAAPDLRARCAALSLAFCSLFF